jgi:hypothetical protein
LWEIKQEEYRESKQSFVIETARQVVVIYFYETEIVMLLYKSTAAPFPEGKIM